MDQSVLEEKINSLRAEIANIKYSHDKDIREIKEKSKEQDQDAKKMIRIMSTISESIVEMKVLNDNMQKLLVQNSNKIESIDRKIEDKIERTDKRINTVKKEIQDRALEGHLKILPMIRDNLPNLIFLGILFVLMTLLQGGF